MQRLHCFACHDFLSTDPGLRPTRRDCLRCHRAEGVLPARFSDDAPMQFSCGACHHPHARSAQQEQIPCATCHKNMERAGLHGWKGHRGSCRGCHQAHLWRAERKDCLRCHATAEGHGDGKGCATCHGFRGAPRPLPPRT